MKHNIKGNQRDVLKLLALKSFVLTRDVAMFCLRIDNCTVRFASCPSRMTTILIKKTYINRKLLELRRLLKLNSILIKAKLSVGTRFFPCLIITLDKLQML